MAARGRAGGGWRGRDRMHSGPRRGGAVLSRRFFCERAGRGRGRAGGDRSRLAHCCVPVVRQRCAAARQRCDRSRRRRRQLSAGSVSTRRRRSARGARLAPLRRNTRGEPLPGRSAARGRCTRTIALDGLATDMTLRTPWRAAERRLRRMMAIARIETLRLTRDRVAISLIALVPAVQLNLFGYAVTLDPKNGPIAIAGSDASSVDRAARVVGETGYFKIIGEALPSGAAERMVVAGQALVGIELPPSPDEEEAGGTPVRARVVVDATDPGAVRPALAALETAYWQKRATTVSLDDRPSADVRALYNPQRRTAWTIVPGLVGVIVMISMLMLGALTLVRERERGGWEPLLATPAHRLVALVATLCPYIVIGTVQGVVAVGLTQLLFDLPARGGIWALLAAAPVYATANLILGFAFSALPESQMQAMQGAVFFYLPSMLLSGFMFPFHGMPCWARGVGDGLPLTHFVSAAGGALLQGQDVGVGAHRV